MLIALLDIVLGLNDSSTNSKYQAMNMTELVVLGLKDKPDGKHFPLSQASFSPKQWQVEGSIEL
jgi:hypothetical protein